MSVADPADPADPVQPPAFVEPAELPVFVEPPLLDAVVQVLAELAAELWTVKRRLDLTEQELVALGGRPLDEIPIGDAEASRSAAAAREFLDGIFRAFTAAAEVEHP